MALAPFSVNVMIVLQAWKVKSWVGYIGGYPDREGYLQDDDRL